MGTIYIDDQPVVFEPGQNVLQAALNAGLDTPYFCYHEALGSAGSCRVCAMELEPVREGGPSRVVMTCMQPAQDGQRYRLEKGKARKVRKNVVEYYMTRHPHDCPVCDEAGECHLQDMTILSHQTYRRYDGKKMTFPNQDMGSLIWNTANRCITCYRCVRFYQNYALGDDFGTYGSGQRTTFRRAEPGAFESPFSGNLIDVCPTGTFTDKVYRRKYSRTWQLDKAVSVCGHCSTGCNTEPGGRKGTLRRIHPYAHAEINPFFICDRGRFGEHYSESDCRPLKPESQGTEDTIENVFSHMKDRLEDSRGRVGVLSSALEDIETHQALQRLARHYEGMFSPFILPGEESITRTALRSSINPPSLTDIEKADGAFIVGSLTEAAPMMDLAVRQLIAKGKPVYMIHAAPSLLADLIGHHGDGHVTRVAPSRWADTIHQMKAMESVEESPNLFANLDSGQRIVVLGVASEMDIPAINALHDLARGFEYQQLNVQSGFALEGANAAGAAILGEENSAAMLLDAIHAGSIETLVVCGADPFGEQGSQQWKGLRDKIPHLIVLDNIATETVKQANVVVPMSTWSERRGLSVNYEGRLQAFDRAYFRPDVLSAQEFVARLTGDQIESLSCDRDAWVMNVSDHLVMAGQTDVRLDLVSLLGKMPSRQETVKSSGLQFVMMRWHGEGERANFSGSLAENRPWKDDAVYLHGETAEKLGLETGDALKFANMGDSLAFICDDRIARDCIGMTAKSLHSIGYSSNELLNDNEFSIERGQ